MFKTPDISIAVVNKFVSDEIHITNKQSGNPKAVLSFTPVDDNNERITVAPVAVVSLEGEAFNYWFENWNTEKDLYSLLIDILKKQLKGITITGVDIARLGSLDNLVVGETEEVLAEIEEKLETVNDKV